MMYCINDSKNTVAIELFKNKEKKEDLIMIIINKEEKEQIKAVYPEAHIIRTMKGKSKRGRYYCAEESKIMKLLDEIRAKQANIV